MSASSDAPQSVERLEELLSEPPADLIESLSTLEGDLVLLGAGGKMGPTMARMAVRALCEAGKTNRVLAVSRFRDAAVRRRLESWGVTTVACDLLDERQVSELPDAAHVISMSGFKFGARSAPELAWATNCYLPALVCRRYRDSRITAFSTGNVYGLTEPESGGSKESDPPAPIGEYAHTALGRERMFQYFSQRDQIPVTMLRLNYATELRYGVLVDLALLVRDRRPVPLAMGHVNVIWLADANAMTLRALALDDSGYQVLNLAGEPVLEVERICRRLAESLGVPVQFEGQAAERALLNDGRDAYRRLGRPEMDAERMIDWTAAWVGGGGELLGKPTHFEVRDGTF